MNPDMDATAWDMECECIGAGTLHGGGVTWHAEDCRCPRCWNAAPLKATESLEPEMADNVLAFPDLIPAPTPGRCDLRSFLDYIVQIAVELHDPKDALALLAVFEQKARAQGWPAHIIGREARRVRDVIERVQIDRARKLAFVLGESGQSFEEFVASAKT
jgi:hypothetical protein